MKKNKLFFLFIASLLSFGSLAGCGGNSGEQPGNSNSVNDNSSAGDNTSNNQGGDTSNNQGSSNGGGQGGSTSNGGGSTSQGGNTSTSQGGNTSTSQGGGSQTADWTNDQKELMQSKLYGVVLPYLSVSVDISTKKNDFGGDELEFKGTETSMPANTLSQYAELFTEQDGWEGGDVSSQEGQYAGTIYSFNKAVMVNGARRYVNATFTGLSGESYNKAGRFVMYASDPYLYEYPAQFVNGWLAQEYGTDCFPPAVQADYYNLYDEGVLLCFTNTNNESTYKTAIIAAGFTVDANKDSEGFFVAHPSDGSYVASFKYDSDIKALILKVSEVKGWNPALIKKFYQKYNQTPLTFPAFNIEGASYKFEEDATNETAANNGYYSAVHATYTISKTGLTKAPLADYATALRNAGYSVNSTYEDTQYYMMKTLADGIFYQAWFVYDDGQYTGVTKPQIVVDFYAAGQTAQGMLLNWPAESVQRFLGAEITDSVPAFTGRQCGFQYNASSSRAGVVVCMDTTAAATAKNDYVGLLTNNGYTLKNNKYVSRNDQIAIALNDPSSPDSGNGLYNALQIAITKVEHTQTAWPSSQIASAIQSNIGNNITDTIPALDVASASDCYVNTNYTDYHFEICIDGLASSMNSFKGVFKTAGWTEDANYEFDYNQTGVLVSPNKQMVAYFYTAGNDLVIAIKAYFGQQQQVEYRVVGSFNEWSYDYGITFSDATVQSEVEQNWYVSQLKATFTVKAGDEFKVWDGITGDEHWLGFSALLSNDSFEAGENNNIKAKEAGKVELYFKTYAEGDTRQPLAINFTADTPEPPEPAEWPENDIVAIIGDERYIIDLSISGASYVVSRQEEQGSVFALVTYTLEGKTSSVAIKEVLALLNDAEYILVDKMEYPDLGMYMYQYFTGDMYIMVSTSDETHLAVMFMPGYTMPMEGYGFFVMNQDGTYESLQAEQIDNYGDYEQYKIDEYEFKQGQMFVLFNFGTHNDFKAALENAGEYVEWDEDEKCYVVKQDFTADVYIKLKYEDDKLYFDIKQNNE